MLMGERMERSGDNALKAMMVLISLKGFGLLAAWSFATVSSESPQHRRQHVKLRRREAQLVMLTIVPSALRIPYTLPEGSRLVLWGCI
jgi:hypothetical protein